MHMTIPYAGVSNGYGRAMVSRLGAMEKTWSAAIGDACLRFELLPWFV